MREVPISLCEKEFILKALKENKVCALYWSVIKKSVFVGDNKYICNCTIGDGFSYRLAVV
jgi:hypothetical protein